MYVCWQNTQNCSYYYISVHIMIVQNLRFDYNIVCKNDV